LPKLPGGVCLHADDPMQSGHVRYTESSTRCATRCAWYMMLKTSRVVLPGLSVISFADVLKERGRDARQQLLPDRARRPERPVTPAPPGDRPWTRRGPSR